MNSDDKDARARRIRAIRTEHGCGIVEAVRLWNLERLLPLLENATTVEELKPILRHLLEKK